MSNARNWMGCLIVAAAAFSTCPAMGWDAGPKDCVHDSCSGGRNAGNIEEYSDGAVPGRVADCPAGYTNLGAVCGRGADSNSTPSKLPDCPAGYTNIGPAGCVNGMKFWDRLGPSHFTCPAGYFLDKVVYRCHKDCAAGYTQMGESCARPTAMNSSNRGLLFASPSVPPVPAERPPPPALTP